MLGRAALQLVSRQRCLSAVTLPRSLGSCHRKTASAQCWQDAVSFVPSRALVAEAFNGSTGLDSDDTRHKQNQLIGFGKGKDDDKGSENDFAGKDNRGDKDKSPKNDQSMFRLSRLITQYSKTTPMSRREAERLILQGEVTVAGKTIRSPHFLLSWKDATSSIKVSGKHVHLVTQPKKGANADGSLSSGPLPKVWLVNKLPGEVVSDEDPFGRPSMLVRLKRGGVGKQDHLKSIGRLDMSTEGLVIVTNDGNYKRQLELPSNHVHRVYRARVHGKLTPYKLRAIRTGTTIDQVVYNGMDVEIEAVNSKRRPSTKGRQNGFSQGSTNTWIRITCTEGKNRQIRKVLTHLGCEYAVSLSRHLSVAVVSEVGRTVLIPASHLYPLLSEMS